jgi:hypothetical protein
LSWSFNKSLTDVVCELEHGDKVAYGEAKAHRECERSTVIAVLGEKVNRGKKASHFRGIAASSLARAT